MGTTDNNKFSEIVDIVKSWISRRPEHMDMSRNFWMPDESCRVCYECDSQFTIFNRRHHCRLCGRVFCARCTANSVPALSDEPRSAREDWDRVRVCNYCFKQWEQGFAAAGNGMTSSSPRLSPSSSTTSLVSIQSSCHTCNSNSSAGSAACSTGSFQHVPYSACHISGHSAQTDSNPVKQDLVTSPANLGNIDARDIFCDQFGSPSRSDDEDDDYSIYRSHSEVNPLSRADICYDAINYGEIDNIYEPHEVQPHTESADPTRINSDLLLPENFETQKLDEVAKVGEETDKQNHGVESGQPPLDRFNGTDVEPVNYEDNGLLWHPPEPEDEEDEREPFLFDDDDGVREDSTGEWSYLRSSSFGSGESRSRDRSNEEHRKAMKKIVDGHFRALITQLLQVEDLPVTEDSNQKSWLDIITALSWEAATSLKPDTSMGGGMDPGGYVKVKCIACGHRNDSTVVKGVVCKKNVAHRRMISKVDKARLLLLGGALEYQRVANHLSSFDTLLQQEMDHLKMSVAKIDAHHPNVLLVEKSVSRYAQDYLLAKDISLVLNVKRALLQRIARCTGADIVPSIDHLTDPKLGYCDSFHVEKFLEEHGSAGHNRKNSTRTLMFFEGCPKPLGCTILLKGASADELKKVKHVVQYGVFAAYHLALETSFLADEGASLPEFPLKSPMKIALPDKPSNIDRSISTIPGFAVTAKEKPQGPKLPDHLTFQSRNDLFLDITQSSKTVPMSEAQSPLSEASNAQILNTKCTPHPLRCNFPGHQQAQVTADHASEENNGMAPNEYFVSKTSSDHIDEKGSRDNLVSNCFLNSENSGQSSSCSHVDRYSGQHNLHQLKEIGSVKEEFPPSPSDHQSILVSLSTRCVWKRTVCERAHLFRIKYYGSFDKPLGRFLLDHLSDKVYRCRSCEMPSEAHVHCYTHQQGSLTISVRKLLEFLLPGEREGNIWMWHRCLRCPRTNGFPPATKRVVMSDAAWGLSFGKFLELSFSNHASASRVASCGHSLHRDCLRFYGLGRMVACFRYAPIDVLSVHLPPSKLEFNYDKQEWIQKEVDEVRSRADLLFSEVLKILHQMSGKNSNKSSMEAPELGEQISELEVLLQKEKEEFEESFQHLLYREVRAGQPAVDILEINQLRRQLVMHCYVWDQRLIHVSRSDVHGSKLKQKFVNSREMPSEIDVASRASRGFSSRDSSHSSLSSMELDMMQTQADLQKSGKTVRRAQSGGGFAVLESSSATSDSAWIGDHQIATVASKENGISLPDSLPRASFSGKTPPREESGVGNCTNDQSVAEVTPGNGFALSVKGHNDLENSSGWMWIPFLTFHYSFNKNSSTNAFKLGKISDYNPAYISTLRELVHQGGIRLLLPMASEDTVVPVFDDEPTSIISYALVSPDYQNFMSEELGKQKNSVESSTSLSFLDSVNLLALQSFSDAASESLRSLASADESILSNFGSRSFASLDPLLFTNTLHARVDFSDDGPQGKVKYSVTCYFAKQFEALRRTCCPSELDFIRSLSRCKKWGAQGGKSNVFFAKTLDDRFIIKQVTKTELESFIKFAPDYFKYLSESLSTGCPTCLAKILGIYQVTSKHLKGGKESRMDVLVMENLLFMRNIKRLYDLKGSSRSRYNPDSSGSNKVLLDENLIEAMPTSPIFLGTKAKRLLERAVWNDTSFLASIDVMDYSLLVGVDEEKHELVLGIIDFMRQYTWDKHLETWVKASGILGGPKNASPTVISPMQYKKRFRKAMSAYFLMVPEQWSSSAIIPGAAQSDLSVEENSEEASIKL
ncbi:1-phosphatidylinositol-3-phosphate 5-kinase FAB1A-like [Olea europaea subsp. europaea]|uniref:1-phosphatidylinositol-3-phosphate 5-kinase n=2 Tax=Olea europaea subsp. europaea TaxID=158383 RepID=A0A8S0U8N7_OLEEU|nr:1-phosphatidylinositol-3-phosphate 5-kinase FAB1A-like [Olea europaea subsp. europaea]